MLHSAAAPDVPVQQQWMFKIKINQTQVYN